MLILIAIHAIISTTKAMNTHPKNVFGSKSFPVATKEKKENKIETANKITAFFHNG